MCPCGTNSHNPQDMLRESLASLATHILIDAIHDHWLHRLCGAPSWFDRLEKSPLKADLVIYTHVLGVPGQYEIVALMLSHKMDFYCCANRNGFHKSSHI